MSDKKQTASKIARFYTSRMVDLWDHYTMLTDMFPYADFNLEREYLWRMAMLSEIWDTIEKRFKEKSNG